MTKTLYYVESEDKIVLVDEDRSKLENTVNLFMPQYQGLPILETEKEIENFMFVDSEEWVEWKSQEIRNIRDQYLKDYVDPVVTNPLRWSDLSTEEQDVYKNYRTYLLDITKDASFPKVQVLTLDEWKEQASK